MATTYTDHADETDPPSSGPAVVRRQLLTARGSHEAVPRVVLHLPDLDALSSVALGPPRPAATRRRIDAAHAVVAKPHEAPQAEGTMSLRSELAAGVRRRLLNLVKAPVGKVVEGLAPNGRFSLTRTLVVLQSPKVLLAGMTAIALQFAALLALFTGGGKATSTDAPPAVAGAPQVTLPGGAPTAAVPGLIQTPLSGQYVQYGVPGGATPLVVVQPTLPPPQTLPGIDPRDVPPWGGAPSAAPPLANQPAALPTPAPPLAAPSLPTLQTGDASAGKPKARLQGTIKKASISENAP